AAVIDAALGGATADDNCDGDISEDIVTNTGVAMNTGGCFWSVTRTWEVMDEGGNPSVQKSRTVTYKVDTTIPVITVTNAADPTNLGCNPTAAVIDAALGGATADDNCDGDISEDIVTNTGVAMNTGGCFWSVTRTWDVMDECGNPAVQKSRTGTCKVDTTIPVITVTNAADPTNLGCNPTAAVIDAALGGATADDNCDGDISEDIVTNTGVAMNTGGCFWSVTRTWDVMDECGNPAVQKSRTVTYKVDTTIPVITVTNAADPTDLGCNPTAAVIDAALGGATADDNCDGDISEDIVTNTGVA